MIVVWIVVFLGGLVGAWMVYGECLEKAVPGRKAIWPHARALIAHSGIVASAAIVIGLALTILAAIDNATSEPANCVEGL